MISFYREVKALMEQDPSITLKVGPIFTGRSESLALDLASGSPLKFVHNPELNRSNGGRYSEFWLMGRAIAALREKQPPKLVLPE